MTEVVNPPPAEELPSDTRVRHRYSGATGVKVGRSTITGFSRVQWNDGRRFPVPTDHLEAID